METADQSRISNSCLLSHMESLYRYAIVLSRDAASASDLVQEIYVRVLVPEITFVMTVTEVALQPPRRGCDNLSATCMRTSCSSQNSRQGITDQ